MKRKSLVTAISLPNETSALLERLQAKTHRSRSGLLRDMIDFYIEAKNQKPLVQNDDSPNNVLKQYYKLISEIKTKPTIVVGAAIINKKDRVIIGLRKDKDPLVKDLHWTFPSGKFESLSFENGIIKTCLRETGFKVKVIQLVHARIFPDSPKKKTRIIVLYYHCQILAGKEKAGGDFNKLKWIPAAEVSSHFTTSVSDEIITFLGTL